MINTSNNLPKTYLSKTKLNRMFNNQLDITYYKNKILNETDIHTTTMIKNIDTKVLINSNYFVKLLNRLKS